MIQTSTKLNRFNYELNQHKNDRRDSKYYDEYKFRKTIKRKLIYVKIII